MGDSRQRGRPRHPDILTPGEWEVLGLLREGLTNREIGDHMGVTQDAAKYHVGEILSKLGVESREQAAAWTPQLEPASEEPVRWGLLSRVVAGLPLAAKGALVAASAAALTGVGILGWGVASGGFSGESADAPAVATEGLGQIAFVRDGDLWTLDIDTGEEVSLKLRTRNETFGADTEDLHIDRPRWSPDGRFIAYHLRSEGEVQFDVNQVTTVGGEIVTGGGYTDAYYEWSPPGDRIGFGALAVEEVLEHPFVTTAAGDASRVPKFSSETYMGEGEFRWSPDGRTAVASVYDEAAGAAKLLLADPELFVPGPTPGVPEDIAGVTLLLSMPGAPSPYSLHSWSPDGRYIAVWPPGGDALSPLQLIDLEEGDVAEVGHAEPEQDSAAWAPDGSAIAVLSGGEFQDGTDFAVYSPEGEEVWRIQRPTESSSQPAWSDDGSRLAFVAAPEGLYGIPDAYTRIWAMHGNGINPRQLTEDEQYMDRYPQWSAAGEHILFVRIPATEGEVAPELWLMRADGSEQRQLTSLPPIPADDALYFDDWDSLFDWHRGEGADAGPTPDDGFVPATATPAATIGDFPPITVGEPIDFPQNVALIIETGCSSCDAPPDSLLRVYRRADGSIAQDVLFDVDKLNLPPDGDEFEPYISTYGIRPDLSEIVVVTCVRGNCGYLAPADLGGETLAYRSTDGGITWEEWLAWPVDYGIVGFVEDGLLAWRRSNAPGPTGVPLPEGYEPLFEYVVLPQGEPATPPSTSRAATRSNSLARPVVTDDGEILWPDNAGHLVDAEDNVALTLPAGAERVFGISGTLASGLVLWWQPPGNGSPAYLTRYEGGTEPAAAATYEVTREGRAGGVWHPKLGLYTNVQHYSIPPSEPAPSTYYVEFVPGIMQLGSSVISPVVEPFLGSLIEPNARNLVVAFQHGPLLRVVGTESCLNVRAAPQSASPSLACVADGVLLVDIGEGGAVVATPANATPGPGSAEGWLHVITPSGIQGWVVSEFIER